MEGFSFSVPYNGDFGSLKEIFKLNKTGKNKVGEIYLSGIQEYCGSGRKKQKITLPHLIEIVQCIHREGIRVNLILNSVCEGSDWYSQKNIDRVLAYIQEMHKTYGLEAITLANPIIIKEARKRFPDLEICASVLSDIDTVKKAIIFKEAGADTITPDANINRDLKILAEIKKATGVKLKIMVNEGCLYKCPFRKFHFNYISHRSKDVDNFESCNFDFTKECCGPIIDADPSQILKSPWIRPEDIKKYSDITIFFKIVGRETPTNRTLRTIKAYMEESWNRDILDIMCSSLLSYSLKKGVSLINENLEENKFFEVVTSCNRNCTQCNYCENLSKKLLITGKLTTEKLRDLGYQEEADRQEYQENRLNDYIQNTAVK